MEKHPHVAEHFRRCLALDFTLYRPEHRVRAHAFGEKLFLSYLTENTHRRDVQTYCDLQLEDDLCYVNGFRVRSFSRRLGFGRELYSATERFAQERGCAEIVLTPSGQGKLFWPEMGFVRGCKRL